MDIFKIYFDDKWNLNFSMHWMIFAITSVFIGFWVYKFIKRHWLFTENIDFDSAEIGINGQKITIKPNYINIDVAYKIWVELNTRKIGLPIDFEHDVIYEVYNSWYQFFGVSRELIKNLPAIKIRNDKGTKELIKISTRILNEGLRPHLTQWQARYRRWYERAIKDDANNNKSPQQVQSEYPDLDLLKTDMERINRNLIAYKSKIYELAFGK